MNSQIKKLCDFIKNNQNTPLSPEQYNDISPEECMYKNSQGEDFYSLWQKYNKDIKMPESMERYNPYTATTKTLTFQEWCQMITGWLKYWDEEPLPENLRHPLLKSDIIKIDKNTYTTPSIIYLLTHGKDASVPDYIYTDNCKESVGPDGEIYSFVMARNTSVYEKEFNSSQ